MTEPYPEAHQMPLPELPPPPESAAASEPAQSAAAAGALGGGRRCQRGFDVRQQMLLPPSGEDWIAKNNPVRAIAVYVDGLDLAALGSKHAGGGPGRGQLPLIGAECVGIDGKFSNANASAAGVKRLERLDHEVAPLQAQIDAYHAEHKLIVDGELTTAGNDMGKLVPAIARAREAQRARSTSPSPRRSAGLPPQGASATATSATMPRRTSTDAPPIGS